MANLILELYRRDPRGFVKDWLIGILVVAAIAAGSIVSLALADWLVNG